MCPSCVLSTQADRSKLSRARAPHLKLAHCESPLSLMQPPPMSSGPGALGRAVCTAHGSPSPTCVSLVVPGAVRGAEGWGYVMNPSASIAVPASTEPAEMMRPRRARALEPRADPEGPYLSTGEPQALAVSTFSPVRDRGRVEPFYVQLLRSTTEGAASSDPRGPPRCGWTCVHGAPAPSDACGARG